MGDIERMTICIGCGASVPETRPHASLCRASPGCWAILNEVQVRGYEDVRRAIGQLGVDAYMAQHPGTPSPQSIQSVMVHLSVCASRSSMPVTQSAAGRPWSWPSGTRKSLGG